MSQDCTCEAQGFPLASICGDDLFCPQCGGRVAWLSSPRNELPNPDRAAFRAGERLLWVYATEVGGKGNRFTFPLEYHALNENRIKGPRPLILDEAASKVEPRALAHKFTLKILKDPEEHQVHVRLEPDPELVRKYGAAEWAKSDGLLPPGGIPCELTLVGNCGKETFDLLVLGEPRYEIEVEENGQRILDNPPDEATEPVEQAWALSRRGAHELTIFIRCAKGFLHLPEMGVDGQDQNPLVGGPHGRDFMFNKTLPPDRILGPGHDPCKIIAAFDSKDWQQGELIPVHVDFTTDVLESSRVTIPLYLEPRGDVEFHPQREYRLPLMYYGERHASQPEGTRAAVFFPHIKLSNRGDRALEIRKPTFDPPDVNWIQVDWFGGGRTAPVSTVLGIGPATAPIELTVTIDLSRVTARDQLLRATILVESMQDGRPPWELPVVLPVAERPLLRSPLAIDFGNSNTFAVSMQGNQFIPLLGDGDPENFPTALLLTDEPDRSLSNVVIGRTAVNQGQEYPSSMVRGLLKRWLLVDAKAWNTVWTFRTIRDNRPCERQPAELILMFLEKVILECEKTLRKTVIRIGLSYPTNFSPRARKRFDQIIAELERRRKEAYPQTAHPGLADRIRVERISTVDSSPDEASAVAIGFVHDTECFRTSIQPLLADDGSFLVASFDFGGGSIDIALMRFTFGGNQNLLKFRSEHLSFGGDETFGGDKVTFAVFQLVLDRFRAVLTKERPSVEFPVAESAEPHEVGTYRWNNYQHLWGLAEALKHDLCRIGSTASPPNPIAAPGPSATLQHLDADIGIFLNRIRVRDSATKQVAALSDPSSLRDPLRTSMLQITLEHVYDHQIGLDQNGQENYTVRARVKKSIKQLHDFESKARENMARAATKAAEAAAGRPDDPGFEFRAPQDSARAGPLFIVLAGAACRLPLVRQLIDQTFDKHKPHVIGDPLIEPNSKPKSKVGFGLARYLEHLIGSGWLMEDLSRAAHYTHGPIVWTPGAGQVVPWIPTCFPLTHRKWHVLEGIRLNACFREGLEDECAGPRIERTGPRIERKGRQIGVYHQSYELELIGYFDLSEEAKEGDPPKDRKLPDVIDDYEESEVLLRVDGAEDNLLLMVRYGKDEAGNWREYGDWKLIPADPGDP